MTGMTRRKVTVSVDGKVADKAFDLAGERTFSAVVERGLQALIREERARRDLEAYIRVPQTAEELAMDAVHQGPVDDTDDVDWEAICQDSP